jgi:hypothetical protein
VTDPNGAVISGAAVSISSPALQGTPRALSSANGDFIFKLLPPGTYTVSVELNGFAPLRQTIEIGADAPATLDLGLKPAGVRESVTVSAEAESATTAPLGSTRVTGEMVDLLPISRSIRTIIDLSPSVVAYGPDGNFSISGAMTFENVYMINGVQTQDNVRGTPLNLYIEDAIQETTIATSPISAEYGRFTGGVVNAVTRSGGNEYAGSYRMSFENDSWRSVSPFGEPKISNVVPTHEFTLGGPIVKDRTWFFGAGRLEKQTSAEETVQSRIPYTYSMEDTRVEAKLTQSVTPNQRLRFGVMGTSREESNAIQTIMSGDPMDLGALTDRQTPERHVSAGYQGMFGTSVFFEGQYSARRFAFQGAGGKTTDRILGTPLLDNQSGATYWAPAFCGVCGDEERNNDELLLKGSYFASTASGSHDVVFGYDTFNDRVISDSYQSASNYHVWTSGTTIENGVVYPVIDPGFTTYIIHWPLSSPTMGTNYRTHSFFVQDTWRANRGLTVNLGLRYDKNHGRDGSDQLIADDSMLSPRLSVAWDPMGTGRTAFTASYGRYVAGVANAVASSGSPAGMPSIFAYFYEGEPINVDPTQPLVTSDVALNQVFSWFDAAAPVPFQITIPGVQTQIRESLGSPHADNVTFGVRHQVTDEAHLAVNIVDRRFSSFYGLRTDLSTGFSSDEFGNSFDLSLVENTDLVSRHYTALVVDGSYRMGPELTVAGNYTLSSLRGNIEGETLGSGPVANGVLSYPEYADLAWNRPVGNLSLDQRHRVRFWGTMELPVFSPSDRLYLGLVQQIESGTPYGAAGDVSLWDFDLYVENPGYLTPPNSVNYYFTARDEFRTETMLRTDLSLNYNRRLSSRSGAEFFARFQLMNVFNQFAASHNTEGDINTNVVTAWDDPSSFIPFNPFTETPVRGVHWDYAPDFGKPVKASAYTLPRTVQFSLGLKF